MASRFNPLALSSDCSGEVLTAEDYKAGFTVFTSQGHSTADPEPRSRWLMLADKVLLATAREEQRRIRAKIRPHVERYRKITGNKR